MAESIVQVTEGSGKKLHTWSRTIGANTVEDEAVYPAEYPLASYSVNVEGIAITTSGAHVLQLMAGASLNVRIRRIRIQQSGIPAASQAAFQIFRLTTAGTGGTAVTPAKSDNADSAAGATAMTLPTAKGTEGVQYATLRVGMVAAQPATIVNSNEWVQQPGHKGLIIPAGAANGIAVKIAIAIASGAVDVLVEFVETSFL